MKESPRMMVVHGLFMMLLAYFVMTMVLKQSPSVAESRSVMLGALTIIYMVQFGHKLPKI